MNLRRLTFVLLILYILLTFTPSVSIVFHYAPPALLTPFATLTGFTFALLIAGQREGWEKALRFLAIVFAISLLFESVGVATGLVYGPYHYTDKLGPLFLGLVPYLIPVAWFMMSYPSFVIAERIVPATWGYWQRSLAVAAVGGVVMTAWDLIMDPIMVASGHWVWDTNGAYFGIPLQNFWGWWLTVFTTFLIYKLISARAGRLADVQVDRLAVAGYLVAAVGIVSDTLSTGAGNLALIGFFAMLPWVIAGWPKKA